MKKRKPERSKTVAERVVEDFVAGKLTTPPAIPPHEWLRRRAARMRQAYPYSVIAEALEECARDMADGREP